MAHWNDQQEVSSSTTIAHMHLGDGLGCEIETIVDGDDMGYRLTLGSLFASESVRFPHTKEGLENLLRTMQAARNTNGPTNPIGGKLEARERISD
tara:strand:- start:1615 stop:1899 length:285 start_codon:yes stop_codon:yes gene_type:complete